MEQTQDRYPVFEPNQVLSSAQLNQAVNHLDEQDRLTRANLIGIGIVCGLKLFFKQDAGSATISLSRGCGITSEGYLVIQPEDAILTACRKYTPPSEPEHDPFVKDDQPAEQSTYDLWELVTNDEQDATTTELASSEDFTLNDMAVLLFLELKREGLRTCCPTDCNDRGSAITGTVRRLLIHKDDLEALGGAALAVFQEEMSKLTEVPLRRVKVTTLADLLNFQEKVKGFFAEQITGKTAVQQLSGAITQAHDLLKMILPDLDDFKSDKLAEIFTLPPPAGTSSLQYYYDFLRDLTAAYHELREALFRQPALCLPEHSLFPRHLMLGVLSSVDTSAWRTAYYPSPAVGPERSKLKELRSLFDRLNRMILSFRIPETTAALKITPGTYGQMWLSGKSLPFYYTPEVRQYWDAYKKGERSREILSWHVDPASAEHVRNPLLYDIEPYNFFRVEGLIGKNRVEVATNLYDQLKNSNVPFSILHVNADKPGKFLEKHYALEHQAGVTKGGTFVIVHRVTNLYPAGQVVADFALPYRVEKEGGGYLGVTRVKECNFEWFDSRRHLGNLVQREYRYASRPAVRSGSKQRASQEKERDSLDDSYVIKIYRYQIQNTSLLDNDIVSIKVPIGEMATRHLSAVARALNERFPGGLVFDHIPGTNKLQVRYFSDQTFLIEWGGLQGNQIRYKYTPEGISRWQKGIWEPLNNLKKYVVTCRIRDEYRADQYTWLQEDDYYGAQYKTPVPLPTTEELIEWEKMIQVRANKKFSIMPLDMQKLFKAIGSKVHNAYNVKSPAVWVNLVGSWANGSWVGVGRDLGSGFSASQKARFLELRKKVTGKAADEHSNITLLVEIRNNVIDMAGLEKLLGPLIATMKGYVFRLLPGKRGAQKGLPLN